MHQHHLVSSTGLLFMRVLMGVGMAYHGYGKLFGGNIEGLTQGVAAMGLPFPAFMAWAAALAEFGGGIFVAVGLLTRPAAFFIFITMTVAAFIAHGSDPFSKKELALAYWTMAGALVLTGPGCLSLDTLLGKKKA